ncbi:MAG: ABC transporter permease, partial [Deltaproteobacteria bacterium]|nr:ABC transporter permease [Deltaproteobacteria bacterium]
MSALWPIMHKEFLHIVRDPRSLGAALALPLLLLVLFGYAIVLDVRDVGVAVLDLDHSVASRELVEVLTADQAISVAARPASTRELDRLLDAGRVRLAIVIPPAYGEDLKAGKTVPVQVLVDGTDATFAGLALGQVGGSLRYQVTRELETTLRQLGRPGEVPGLHAKTRVFFNETLNGTWFIIPGLIAIIVMLLAALVTSQCVAREYEQNTIEQILVSPVSGPALMLGKLVPYVGVGCLQVLSVTVASRFLFHVPIRGSLLLLAGATLLFLIGSMALGLMLSAVLKSQQLAMMVAFIVTMLPSLILSGFIFPLENMPA